MIVNMVMLVSKISIDVIRNGKLLHVLGFHLSN